MAEVLLPGRVIEEGGDIGGRAFGWPGGVDSFSHPLFLSDLQLRWLENAVLSGRFAQTRPGYLTRLNFDTNFGYANEWWQAQEGPVVHPQMCVRFRPTGGGEQLVFAISGSVFYSLVASDGSLGAPQRITGLKFNRNADQLVGCATTQTATIIAGKYANNIAATNLLIIQDGYSRAGIWDGHTGRHANPAKKIEIADDGGTLYPEAWNQTRIGLWMAWSGNRLFVFDGRTGYASDLCDPTHFTEELRLDSFPQFTFPEDVSGAIDRGTSGTARSQVVVFTQNTVWTLWSGVQERFPTSFGKGWQFTDDFQTKIFDGIGCVAGKSATVHQGFLYWKSEYGLVRFDSTQTVNSSQNLPPIDLEMAYSKLRIAPAPDGADLTCAGKFKNFVWWSVPVGRVSNGRRYNGQTQVLNRQLDARNTGLNVWQGVWTGIRPVEWATVKVGGFERVYGLSLDDAGIVRIWEAMQSNRADNGQRIPWLMETRLHAVQPSIFEFASFKNFRLLIDQIGGNIELVGSWRGLKGNYHELLTAQITATPNGALAPHPTYGTMQGFALQGRTVRSRNLLEDVGCTAQTVESPHSDSFDHAFGLAIQLTGRCAISAYRIAVDSLPDNTEGTAERPTGIDEEGFNIVPLSGCPQHIDGTTPDYIATEMSPSLADCPYLPTVALSVEYQAPAP